MSYRRYSDGDGWAMLTVLVFVVAGFLLYWCARIAWAALTEAIRVYQDHGSSHTKAGKLLRWALIGFGAVVVAGIAGAVLLPMTAGLDATLICWSFFGWAVTVAACGWTAGPRRPDLLDSHVSFGKRGGMMSK